MQNERSTRVARIGDNLYERPGKNAGSAVTRSGMRTER